MKRALALFWSLFFLSGCAVGPRAAPNAAELLARPFSAQINLEWCNETYSGSFTKEEQGGITLTLTGAELITQVTFSSGQGACTITQGALTLTLDETTLPSTSLPSAIQHGFVMLQNAAIRQEQDGLVMEAGRVKLFCRGEDHIFSRLELDRGSIDFTEFTFTAHSS